MEPVSLVVGALAAGALAGVDDVAKTAVGDAYQRLKALLGTRFKGRFDGEMLLVRHDANPETREERLAIAIAETGAASDKRIIAAAQELMDLIEWSGTQAGRDGANLPNAKGVQIGNRNTQNNTFN